MSSRPSTSSSSNIHPGGGYQQSATPSIPPALHQLANPSPILIDSQLPNYLLPNILDLLKDSSKYVIKKKKHQEDVLVKEGLLPRPPNPSNSNSKGKNKQKDSHGDNALGEEEEEEEEEDEGTNKLIQVELQKRIERIGLMVGGYIAEKLTLARPPLASHLDIIKFICKDLFLYVYSKQIDNLRTNHRGIFVLQSHSFPPLIPLSSYKGSSNDIEIAKSHLLFPQALIQGALVRLGMNSVVIAESSGLPQCTFQIRTIKQSTPNPSTPSTSTNTPNTANPSQQGTIRAGPGTSATAGAGAGAVEGLRGSTGLGIAQSGI
ncbi:uncharacterized protein L201_005675 [Kwoniella dendrophila CBS 6074]|uniref:Transporter particle component n=1 Tax=Kwoniella dendrophila CBS 6074 TaxID=1295534 RepID=A0AAX4K0Z7_9TREE